MIFLVIPIHYLREVIYNFIKMNILDYFDFIGVFISLIELILRLEIFGKKIVFRVVL